MIKRFIASRLAITAAVFGIMASCVAQEIEVPRISVYWDRIFISSQPGAGGSVSGAEYSFGFGLVTILTAVPNPGYAFSSWTQGGSVASSNPEFHISVNWSQLSVTPGERHYVANFAAVSYVPQNAKYNGLFISPDEPAHTNSGFISVATTAKGGYTAKILLNGAAYTGSGTFLTNGTASFPMVTSGGENLTVSLQAGLGYSTFLAGTVSNNVPNGWSADLTAYRAKIAPSMLANQYTLLMPGGSDSSNAPSGCGYGTATVDYTGDVTFSGTLGDGTKVSQKAFISENSLWPFYASAGGGSILGWLEFTNVPDSDLSGTLIWRKSPHGKGKGFTLNSDAVGSVYKPGLPPLNLTTGIIVLENGYLQQSVTNEITVTNNIVTGPGGLNLKLTAKAGRFSGKMISPANNKKISLDGVVFQRLGTASGLFTGANQSGTIYIGPDTN